jgi:hypothetical protein
MIKRIPVPITTDASGDYTVDLPDKFTGKFLGFHHAIGTMTTCTITIASVHTTTNTSCVRTLYTKASTGTTNFIPVKVQVLDIAGSGIAAQYEHQGLMDELLRITVASGGVSKTSHLEILLEVENLATHR